MRVLHIEDSSADAELVRVLLTEEWENCVIDVISDPVALVAQLGTGAYDIILSDFSLGSFDGLDALRIARKSSPDTPFIFLSGTIGEDRAIEAMRAGAHDYVIKDRMKRLVTAIKRALSDCQDRRLREESVRRNRYQADLLNKAREAIIVRNQEGVITFWNKGAERITGWTAEEATGRPIEDVIGFEAKAEFEKAQAALDACSEWEGEIRLNDKKGKAIFLEFGVTLIRDDDGRPNAKLCIGTDVTVKKNLEEQFLRVQRLESIGMLASGIAHDLNNVLAPIILGAPMLRERATDPRDIRLLTTLEKSAERGAGLVRQILSFAHGVSGDDRLVDVRHILRDTVAVINETFPKNIQLEYRVSGDLWPILANPSQIHQVLLNLCVNARDAMPGGGKLSVLAENCSLDEASADSIQGARAGKWVLLHIGDTGTGIPPEAMEHIWEPFFTTKEPGKGTGLGLSTVRGIVESHKGFIDLRTEAGKGAVFRVFLPAVGTATNQDSPELENTSPPRGNGEFILVVDDEEQIRSVASAILTRFGYKVITAADGAAALALFATKGHEFEMVITDVNMPNVDGSTLAKVIRKLKPQVTILAMSGLGSGPLNNEIRLLADGVIMKPFKADALLHAVKRHLANSHT